LVAASVGVGVGVALGWRQQRDHAVASQTRAELAERENQARAHLAQASAFRRSGQAGQRQRCLDEVRQALALDPPPSVRDQLRNEAIAALCLYDAEVIHRWPGFHPDTLVIDFDHALEHYLRVDAQGNASVRRVVDDTLVWRVGEPFIKVEDSCKLSPDGRFFAGWGPGRDRLRLEKRDRADPVYARDDVPRAGLAFSPDSRHLAYVDRSGVLRVVETESGACDKEIAVGQPTWVLEFDPNCKRIAVARQKKVRMVDLATSAVTGEWSMPSDVSDLAWHPVGDRLAVSCSDQLIYIRSAELGTNLRAPLAGHKHSGVRAAFNRTGELLLSWDWSAMARLWDSQTGELLLHTPMLPACRMRFGADDRIFGASLIAQEIHFWRISGDRELRRLRSYAPLVEHGDVDVHAGGRLVAVRSRFGVSLWDLVAGQERAILPVAYEYALRPLAFHGKEALRTYGQGGVCEWPVRVSESGDFRVGPPQRLFMDRFVGLCTQSATGDLIGAPTDRGPFLYRLDSVPRAIALGPQRDVRCCAMSPCGRWVATASHSPPAAPRSSVRIWNATDGSAVATLPVGGLATARFSPDGRWLGTMSRFDNSCQVWEVESWAPGPRWMSQLGFCFSPNGQVIALDGDATGIMVLAETGSGRELARFYVPDATRLCPQCFTPDGNQILAIGADNGLLYVWDLRVIRRQLLELGLDWDQPRVPPAHSRPNPRPLRVDVELR
jgi:WD40 repeat protein